MGSPKCGIWQWKILGPGISPWISPCVEDHGEEPARREDLRRPRRAFPKDRSKIYSQLSLAAIQNSVKKLGIIHNMSSAYVSYYGWQMVESLLSFSPDDQADFRSMDWSKEQKWHRKAPYWMGKPWFPVKRFSRLNQSIDQSNRK